MTNTLSPQEWLRVIKEDYLEGFVSDGGSSLKFVVPARRGLSSLLRARISAEAGDKGYLVVNVDSGVTKVHMLQEVFFRIAEQMDWRQMARQVVLRLAEEADYRTGAVDLQADTPILESLSEASSAKESMIRMKLSDPPVRVSHPERQHVPRLSGSHDPPVPHRNGARRPKPESRAAD